MSLATAQVSATPIRAVSSHDAAAAVLPLKTQCSQCHLRDLCLPCGMSGADVDRLDTMKFTRRSVKEGQALYHEGDAFHFIYALRNGTFKSSLSLADGREQVSGFQISGELLGLDGLAEGKYASSATALEDTVVCAIPYAHLTELANSSAGMQRAVSRLMSREIVRDHNLLMLLGSMNAEERLATFLLNLSRRLQARGYSPGEFVLRMTRAEIGSYLGMKLETVSRTFSAFQRQGLLEVVKRHIRILDMAGLVRVHQAQMH